MSKRKICHHENSAFVLPSVQPAGASDTALPCSHIEHQRLPFPAIDRATRRAPVLEIRALLAVTNPEAARHVRDVIAEIEAGTSG